jgi:hypothetical protein
MPAVAMAPNRVAQISGAARNCQADSPVARAITSSEERVRRQNATMPPSSTAKGRICNTQYGSRSSAMLVTRPIPTSGRVAARRSNSI